MSVAFKPLQRGTAVFFVYKYRFIVSVSMFVYQCFSVAVEQSTKRNDSHGFLLVLPVFHFGFGHFNIKVKHRNLFFLSIFTNT